MHLKFDLCIRIGPLIVCVLVLKNIRVFFANSILSYTCRSTRINEVEYPLGVMMGFVLQDGWTPLVIASQEGHLEIVKSLIEAGANVNHTAKVVKIN